MPLAWAATATEGATALERHLTGKRCCLARALPLQERQPWPWTLPMTTCAAPVGASHARGWPHMLVAAPSRGFGRGRPPPCYEPWLQPIAPCSRPGHGWPALHGGWPEIYILLFQIWMEKMKEVKHPPL
ncbi:hypothetical protein GW17_00043669 [Ensete ventricosum]|nr:hypothetical protein GW17_00043669 [Ensete ventricosum]